MELDDEGSSRILDPPEALQTISEPCISSDGYAHNWDDRDRVSHDSVMMSGPSHATFHNSCGVDIQGSEIVNSGRDTNIHKSYNLDIGAALSS
jgi:hypothetical protein